jgi:hypothetical protein
LSHGSAASRGIRRAPSEEKAQNREEQNPRDAGEEELRGRSTFAFDDDSFRRRRIEGLGAADAILERALVLGAAVRASFHLPFARRTGSALPSARLRLLG